MRIVEAVLLFLAGARPGIGGSVIQPLGLVHANVHSFTGSFSEREPKKSQILGTYFFGFCKNLLSSFGR